MHRTLACLFVSKRQWRPNILHCGDALLVHFPMHKDMDGSQHVALKQRIPICTRGIGGMLVLYKKDLHDSACCP